MGVNCQIFINKAKEGVYRAGQLVTGKVKYVVDEPTEYQHVTLSLLGKGKCVWRRSSAKNRHTYRGKEDYVITHVNVCNKKPEETITLAGEYEYPFEFFLPEDIPRSYKDYIGRISYKIELKFEKPSLFSFNKVFKTEIPVYNYLKPTTEGPIKFGLQKELFAPFAAKTPVVSVKAEIDKAYLIPGENAHISYIVTNDSDVEIKTVKTELHYYKTYTDDRGHKKYVNGQVESCETSTPSVPARKVSSFTSLLPTRPELYSIQNSKIISLEYEVLTIVILPLPHLNGVVKVPVLIGEVKESTEQDKEALEDGEQPPTYWEAMNEGKKKGDKSDDESD